MLTRESFFAVPPEMPFETVETPMGAVRVYTLTLGEKDAFDISHAKADGRHFRARLLVATLRDEGGKPIFGEADIPKLDGYPLPMMERLFKAAVIINRMTDDEAEALRKN